MTEVRPVAAAAGDFGLAGRVLRCVERNGVTVSKKFLRIFYLRELQGEIALQFTTVIRKTNPYIPLIPNLIQQTERDSLNSEGVPRKL